MRERASGKKSAAHNESVVGSVSNHQEIGGQLDGEYLAFVGA